MNHENQVENHTRNLRSIIADALEELKQFLNTRMQVLKSELRETVSAMRVAVPLGVLAVVLLSTAFLLLTGAAVCIVASAFAGSPYAWFYAFIIVGFVWGVMGLVAGFFAYNEFRSKAVFPKRTVEVLKADKNWIQSEARTTYGRAA
jgi:VIT1/CCC1 family predicted Fe2+/Mn2+ transporter